MAQWITKAWRKIRTESIVKGFKKNVASGSGTSSADELEEEVKEEIKDDS